MNQILLLSVSLYLLAATMPLILFKLPAITKQTTAITTAIAALVSLIPAISVIVSGLPVEIILPWNLPLGSFHLKMDLLSAWFNLPLAVVSILTCSYGLGYRKDDKNDTGIRGMDAFDSFLAILIGGMFMVLVSWDGVVFLLVWELMSFAAFFLVLTDHDKPEVRKASWIYLAATHIGTAFLFVMFVLWTQKAGSTDFNQMAGVKEGLNVIFLLALVGFGSKAGFFGLHVWLPEAHPAAPSSVSGLMSGIMIKMGIYGIFRVLSLTSNWEVWWGLALAAIGVFSGLGGVMFALIQRDMKRMLAYCSVENIGIICLGMGLGVIGVKYNQPAAIWGFAGALFHVLNHALFKTGLFMGAGSVVHATHTRLIDSLGGLQSKMPVTTLTFLLFSAAICGLPPLNGFASELFIYMDALYVLSSGTALGLPALMSFTVIASLALIGGLALFGFLKLFGVTFLGQARTELPPTVKDPVISMKIPMILIAFICLALGLGAYFPAKLALLTASVLLPLSAKGTLSLQTAGLLPPDIFWIIPLAATALIVLIVGAFSLRKKIQKKKTINRGPLWGCGYNQPTARMQYSGASFSEPMETSFKGILQTEDTGSGPNELIPLPSKQETLTPDPCMKRFYNPVFGFIDKAFSGIRRIQHGRIALYILYIIIALVAVITWSCLW